MHKKIGNMIFGVVLVSLLIVTFVLGDLPVVPGFNVEIYAEPPYPVTLCFGSAGEIYTGWDSGSPPWGLGRISRIAPGGGPGSVTSIGPVMTDPDSVAYDSTGQISGFPGSVIVGGGYPPHLTAIKSDGTSQVLWTGPFVNPSDIDFDSTGRMLILDGSYPGVFETTGGQPVLLFSTSTYAEAGGIIVVDDNDNIYLGGYTGITRYDQYGNSLGNPLVEFPYDHIVTFAFGPGGAWGNSIYFISNHELLKVDFPNVPVTIGTGFISVAYHDMVFGPDGALYICDYHLENRILRISPIIIIGPTFPQPPIANAGLDQIVEQESYDGTLVTLDGSESTDPDSTPGTNDNIVFFEWYEELNLLGSEEVINHIFQLGIHVVTLVVTDSLGEMDEDEVIITVVDTTPPEITCPADITVEQESYDGTEVILEAIAIDNCDPEPVITSDELDIYPLGETIVTFTATDSSGNSASCSMIVTVVDTTPPVISSILANPYVLFPPNKKMVEVIVEVDAEDICDSEPFCYILGISSNEPINSLGNSNAEPDWEYTDNPLVVLLRAEKDKKGNGRIYILHVVCEDASGNIATMDVEVIVPHKKGKDK